MYLSRRLQVIYYCTCTTRTGTAIAEKDDKHLELGMTDYGIGNFDDDVSSASIKSTPVAKKNNDKTSLQPTHAAFHKWGLFIGERLY